MKKGSRTNSTWDDSRSRCERHRHRSKSKNVSWSPDVKDTGTKTPEAHLSAMGSRGSSRSHSRSSLEAPSKLQKINETSGVQFLTAEEAIKRASIELPTSIGVRPTEGDRLSSAKVSQAQRRYHSPRSSKSSKRASPLATDSRESSPSDQYKASWRSESTDNEEAPPGFTFIKSEVVGKLNLKEAEDDPHRQASSDGQDGRGSTMDLSGMSSESGPSCALQHVQPGNTAHVIRKRRFVEKKSAGKEDLHSRMDSGQENPRRQASSDGQDGRESTVDLPGFRKRRFLENKSAGKEDVLSRMDTGQEDGGLASALPKKTGGSCKMLESGGVDALMPEKCDGPDGSMKLINNPAGVKFQACSTSNCNDGQERNLQRNLPKSQEDPENVPAINKIWTGNFDVCDKSNVIRYEGILAHLSARVSCRVYKLSKQIPGVLLFDMHHRHDFWPPRFQTGGPGRNDIALYFYPGHYERSSNHYCTILKLIEKDDLVLRSRMGNVQLLVYSSKLMPANLQRLNGSYFMWGVFCGPKAAFKGRSLPSSSPSVA